jgi:hypothetical protein
LSIHLLALVIQDAEQPTGLSLNHGQAASIVLKVNALPLDALFAVLLLLILEHMLIEVKLQMLIGIVDAELLIAVKEKHKFYSFKPGIVAKHTCCSF